MVWTIGRTGIVRFGFDGFDHDAIVLAVFLRFCSRWPSWHRKVGFSAFFRAAAALSSYGCVANDLAHRVVERHLEDLHEEVDGVARPDCVRAGAAPAGKILTA